MCDPSGSLSEQCDLITGICNCRENATGDYCELCALGSFGLPVQPCQGIVIVLSVLLIITFLFWLVASVLRVVSLFSLYHFTMRRISVSFSVV